MHFKKQNMECQPLTKKPFIYDFSPYNRKSDTLTGLVCLKCSKDLT